MSQSLCRDPDNNVGIPPGAWPAAGSGSHSPAKSLSQPHLPPPQPGAPVSAGGAEQCLTVTAVCLDRTQELSDQLGVILYVESVVDNCIGLMLHPPRQVCMFFFC